MKIFAAIPMLLVLAACSKPDTAPGPGGVTMGEARALDQAAAMLDERRPPEQLVQPVGTQTDAKASASASAATH